MNDQAQFRVGGVYLSREGRPVKLTREQPVGFSGLRGVPVAVAEYMDEPGTGAGWKRLTDGRYVHALTDEHHRAHLVPGEVTNVNGRWVSMTPTLDKLEAEKDESDLPELVKGFVQREQAKAMHPADARMIAADGPARPAKRDEMEGLGVESKTTAHAPIAGLTRIGVVDHRLGSAFR